MSSSKILIVDDNENSRYTLRRRLVREGYAHLEEAENGHAALSALEHQDFDLILLDIMMPGMNGFEVLQRIRQVERWRRIPVIVVSAGDSDEDAVRCIEMGAADYLAKPFNTVLLRSRVRACLERKRLHDQEIRLLRFHDPATGLFNQAGLVHKLKQFSAALTPCDVFYLLDIQFDVVGKVEAGLSLDNQEELEDCLVQELARSLPPTSVVGKLQHQEFAAILPFLTDDLRALSLAEAVKQSFTQPIALGGHRIDVLIHVGLVRVSNRSVTEVEQLLRQGRLAASRAKQDSSHPVVLYEPAMQEKAVSRLTMQTKLRHALETCRVVPYYQPIVSAKDHRICGFEALARWDCPEKGLIEPNEFIPIAEETGLILAIGDTMLNQACSQWVTWKSSGLIDDAFMSVNVSGGQFSAGAILNQVKTMQAEIPMDLRHLNLEVTETALIADPNQAQEVLRELIDSRVRFSIDDFGTGYSSIGYLRRFSFSTVKIDRSFTSVMLQSAKDQRLVRAMIDLAHSLEMSVTVEGVEDAKQVALLTDAGADYFQGFYFHRPLPADNATALLGSQARQAEPAASIQS